MAVTARTSLVLLAVNPVLYDLAALLAHGLISLRHQYMLAAASVKLRTVITARCSMSAMSVRKVETGHSNEISR
jgi:hypothetical protein